MVGDPPPFLSAEALGKEDLEPNPQLAKLRRHAVYLRRRHAGSASVGGCQGGLGESRRKALRCWRCKMGPAGTRPGLPLAPWRVMCAC